MFEMTASLLMMNEGKKQTFLKVPEFLKNAFGSGSDYLGIDTGKAIIKWLNTGEKEDPEIKRIKSEMTMASENGLEEVLKIWNSLTKPQQKALETHKNICKESAEEYERQKAEASKLDEDDKTVDEKKADIRNKTNQKTEML